MSRSAVVPNRFLVALVALALGVVLAAGVAGRERQAASYRSSELVMDTVVTVTVYGPKAKENAEAALSEFRRIDALLSAYRTGSEVSRVNDAAGRAPVKVSRETLALVQLSLRYAALSHGKFEPTIGPLVRLWGIGAGRTAPPSPAEIEAARRLVDYRRVVIDEARRTIYLPLAGMKLDLGGVAKGYAAQKAGELLRRRGVKSALIDAGGNIVALGARPDGRRWRVAIRHPRQSDAVVGVLQVADQAVVTSGDYERFFMYRGRRYHHLLDPATGYPADALQSATVIFPSSTVADLLSTSVFLLGPEEGPALARREGAGTVLVDSDGRVQVASGLRSSFVPADAPPGAAAGGDHS